MKLAALMLVLSALTDPAAQVWPEPPQHIAAGDRLAKAMAICEEHRVVSGLVILTSPPQDAVGYQSGWEACFAVREKWQRSELGRKERERLEQIERDKDFIKSVAEE